MANKIILDVTLPDDLKKDGDILYGQDLNQIISILKTSVNLLKQDTDTVISGDTNAIVKYDATELDEEAAEDGTYGFVYEDDVLKLFKKGPASWDFVENFSLIALYNKIIALEETPSNTFDSLVVDGRLINFSEDNKGTFEISLSDDFTLLLGQQQTFYGKFAEPVSKGDAIQFADAQGNHFVVKKAVQTEIQNAPELFLGLAAQDIAAQNDWGYILTFGPLIGVYNANFEAGNILWYDSESQTPGALTKTRPARGYAQIRVAAVINDQNATNGEWMIRPDRLEAVDGTKIYIQEAEPTEAINGDLWYKIV